MKSLYRFIVKPLEQRYDNIRKVNDKQLIINTSIEDHRFVSKKAVVVAKPAAYKTEVNVGDVVYVHHNNFRRYYDMKGEEKNSSTFFALQIASSSLRKWLLYLIWIKSLIAKTDLAKKSLRNLF